jgi:hypothetical protein
MIIKDRSYPHPVLAPFKDDVLPNRFEFLLNVSPDVDNYYLDFKFEYANATLSSLIENGHAAHSVHVECRQNFYRRIFSFPERSKQHTISSNELVGRVEVTGFIEAQTTLDQYRIEGSHQDYGVSTFRVQLGDVLAVAPSRTFDAYNDYDPLRQISSILDIRRSKDKEEGEMEIDTDDNRIVATLSQRDFDRYTELKPDKTIGPLLANQVVVPAILEAIHEIRSTNEDDAEFAMRKRWFRSISKKLEDLKIDIRTADASMVKATQAILRLPLRRSLEGLLHMSPLES